MYNCLKLQIDFKSAEGAKLVCITDDLINRCVGFFFNVPLQPPDEIFWLELAM